MTDKNVANLPHGVRLLPLIRWEDARGWLMEAYRMEWFPDCPPAVQWNLSHSMPGSLRGFHVHWEHYDYAMVISGQLHIGLQDMRPWSPTYELATLTTLDVDKPALLLIPPGVGHGFFYEQAGAHIYGASHYWNMDDELSCRWDDSNVKVPWPFSEPSLLSDKDRDAGTFEQMQAILLSHLLPPATPGDIDE